MKKSLVAVLTATLLTLSVSVTWGAPKCDTWNLALDYLRAPNQNQAIYPDACGAPVWHFMKSENLTPDPATYTLLDTFSDYGPYCDPGTGMKSWSGADSPHVSVNASGVNQVCDPWAPITVNSAVSFTHPTPSRYAVVGWKSPVCGKVSVKVAIADLDPWGGDGVDWFIQNGNRMLATGVITNGASDAWNGAKIDIKKGDFLYIGIGPGPNGDYYFDTTALDILITKP